MLRRPEPQAGLTLVELIVGLALFSLLFALGAPTLQKAMANARVRSAADGALSGLQLARGEALRRNTSVRFQLVSALDNSCVLSEAGPNWVVSLKPATGGCQVEPSETVDPIIVQKRSGNEGSRMVRLHAQDAAGVPATTVVFDALGRVANASAVARIDIDSAETDRPLRVQVAPGGEARLCDLAFSSSHPEGC